MLGKAKRLLGRLASDLERDRRWASFRNENPLRDDECALVCDYGIGDHFAVLGFCAAFEARHRLRVRFVAGNAKNAFLCDLFPHRIPYRPWSATASDWASTNEIGGGRYYYAHFPALELPKALGYGSFRFLDAYRCRLALPEETPFTLPCRPSGPEIAAEARFLSDQGLAPGRTVLMCTTARSVPTTSFTPLYWGRLANRLSSEGFSVALNDDVALARELGLPCLHPPLNRFRALVAAAGAVCGVRSGLSDLGIHLECRHVVIYPDVPFFAGPLIKSTTLAQYRTSDRILEVVWQNEDLASHVDRITTFIAS